jgi:hypothetical protein
MQSAEPKLIKPERIKSEQTERRQYQIIASKIPHLHAVERGVQVLLDRPRVKPLAL